MKIIRSGKDTVSVDNSVQAIVEMWDENKLVLNVDMAVSGAIKEGSVVLVDYNPIAGVSPPVPKQTIVKVLSAKQGKECWDIFRKFYAEKNSKKKHVEPEGEPQGLSYSR